MTYPARSPPTVLFTVRLWPEEVGDGQVEWRGEVKRLSNAHTYYFRNWSTLIQLITTMLEIDVSQVQQSNEEKPP